MPQEGFLLRAIQWNDFHKGKPGFSDGQPAMKTFRLKMAAIEEFADHILEGCNA